MDEHTAVLVEAVVEGLAVQPAGIYLDATFGRGGHAARILDALGAQGQLVAIDRDPQAIAAGRLRFAHEPRLRLVHGTFDRLAEILRAQAPPGLCDGVLIDCGVSSPQLDTAERGFSFRLDGPLDMRMDPTRGESVAAWLERAPLAEMQHVIATLGEERFARRIARAIDEARRQAPLVRTGQLAELVARAVPTREPGKHPATRTFQALRMHVNDELGQLARALRQAVQVLRTGGRLAVISFHSLEDRLVKDFMQSGTRPDPVLAKLPVQLPGNEPVLRRVGSKRRADAAEIAANPRARSALLRVAERTAAPAPAATGDPQRGETR